MSLKRNTTGSRPKAERGWAQSPSDDFPRNGSKPATIQVKKNTKRPIQPSGHEKEPFTLKTDLMAGQILAIKVAIERALTAVCGLETPGCWPLVGTSESNE